MNNLKIRKFNRDDFKQAGKLVFNHWSESEHEIPIDLRPLLYEFLVRYYFDEVSDYNFAIMNNDILCGFILATTNTNYINDSELWLNDKINKVHQLYVNKYIAYLNGNREKEQRYLNDGEIVLLFFVSSIRGCGKILLEHFENECRKKNIKSMILWTDETCDFDYYYKNKFVEIAKLKTSPALFNQNLSTYIFRKEI